MNPRPLTLRQVLAAAGGLAGAYYLAHQLQTAEGQPVSVRKVRDRLKNSSIRRLGAGYYGLSSHPALPVHDFVVNIVSSKGPLPLRDAVAAVLASYPKGDPVAVESWFHQEPGAILVDDGLVTVSGVQLSAAR